MKKLNLTKKRLNQKCYEILKNIEILSFIDKNKLNGYIKFIYNKLEKDNEAKKLIPYLKKNWYDKNPDLYNYSSILKYKRDNEGINKYLERLYITNNISESLHGKISFYLPKHSATALNFIDAIKKVLLDDKIKIENIKRYDIKTRAIILIIDELNLNNEFKWIEGKVFKEYEKKF